MARPQTNKWSNCGLFSTRPLVTNFSWFETKYKEVDFENVVCNVVALSPNCINQFVTIMYSKHNVLPWNQLQGHHNEGDGVSNHRRPDCLLNCLLRRRSMKYQSSTSLAFLRGIHQWPVNSPHKGPVSRKMFPFDDVIMRDRVGVIEHSQGVPKSPLCTHEDFFKRKRFPHHWPFVRSIHRFLSLRVSTPGRLCFLWH